MFHYENDNTTMVILFFNMRSATTNNDQKENRANRDHDNMAISREARTVVGLASAP